MKYPTQIDSGCLNDELLDYSTISTEKTRVGSTRWSLGAWNCFEFSDLAGLLHASVLPLPGVRGEQVTSYVPIKQRSRLWGELIELIRNQEECLRPFALS